MSELVVKTNAGAPSQHELMVFETMAKAAVESKMYRGVGEQAGVMMIMLAARELGIPPCQALNGGLNIIQGKVEISARMMNALIRKSGHQITVKESTDEICILIGKRSDTGETQESSFSLVEAQRAGLVKPGGGWQKFPKDMCYARALSRLARQLFSDVVGIGYVEGEIRASEQEIAPIEPPQTAPIIIEVLENDRETLLQKFDKEDRFLVPEYIKVVSTHFGWTEKQCIDQMLKEPGLVEKFSSWKVKQQK